MAGTPRLDHFDHFFAGLDYSLSSSYLTHLRLIVLAQVVVVDCPFDIKICLIRVFRFNIKRLKL